MDGFSSMIVEAFGTSTEATPAHLAQKLRQCFKLRTVLSCSRALPGSLVDAGLAARMHELDTVHRKVLDVLSARAAKILGPRCQKACSASLCEGLP